MKWLWVWIYIHGRLFCYQYGILFEISCVGTPQQNGRVERKHRNILNVACSLRFQANLPIKFLGECILTNGYLINHTPTLVRQDKTSIKSFSITTPPITILKPLDVFVSLQKFHVILISLLHVGVSASLLGILMERRDGDYMILILRISLILIILCFMRIIFPIIILLLLLPLLLILFILQFMTMNL